MTELMQSRAGRLAAQIQRVGTHFDPEILSLPGGSAIAVVLWAYSTVAMLLKRPPKPTAPLLCGACPRRH